MGRGSYTASDWSRLKNSRNIDNARNENDLFLRKEMDPRFDPKFIKYREARDSEDHPESTPIIIGLDVTGSMGFLSHQIAKESLNETMMKLYALQPVKDPAILFAAYGDFQDKAPLQVTQFESDIRVAEQLLDLWLENGGQAQVVPAYLWHFAGEHTQLDNFTKRGEKGFLITIGDTAECRTQNLQESFERVFDEKMPGSVEKILKKASEKFEIFHIFLAEEREPIPPVFQKLLGGHTTILSRSQIDAIPEVIISIMQLTSGMDQEKIIAQWPELKQPVVSKALSYIKLPKPKKGLFF